MTRQHTRFIEDLRGKHQGEEIWVLGCGPSLDVDLPYHLYLADLILSERSSDIS